MKTTLSWNPWNISSRFLSSTVKQSLRFFSSNSADNPPPHDITGTQARFVRTYGIATYDGLFKYILSDDEVRPSFFHAFIPWLSIESSKRIDEHMNPIEHFQTLRDFIHKRENSEFVARLSETPDIKTVFGGIKENRTIPHPKATDFLKELVSQYDEIKLAFPQPKFNGTMGFVCRLDNGEYAMVEIQVIPDNNSDRRALAYVAAFYGNQLRKKGHWKDIKKVIGINILGEGTDNLRRYVDGIELIQYSILNVPERKQTIDGAEQEKKDWITFFKKAHYMQEDEVKRIIKTPF